jgi:plastocyanin
MKLASAYNTDQLGRVFEDRSHEIRFVQLPANIKQDITDNNKKVYNLNARGKIGNNVEVYPAFEYDFAPSRLVAEEGDYLHIQWSGSNTNDLSNDHSQTEENGDTVRVLRGKDRHNMVAIDSMGAIRPTSDLEKLSSLLGLSAVDSMSLAFSGVHGGDNEYLQSSGAYFDLGVKKLEEQGKHMFMSAINNSHGMRTQKGKVIVT